MGDEVAGTDKGLLSSKEIVGIILVSALAYAQGHYGADLAGMTPEVAGAMVLQVGLIGVGLIRLFLTKSKINFRKLW